MRAIGDYVRVSGADAAGTRFVNDARNSARAAWLLAWKQQPECRPAGPRVLPYTRSGDNGQTRECARAFTGATWRREDQPSCVSTLVRLERVRRAVP